MMIDLSKGYIEFSHTVDSDVYSMSGEAKVDCYEELLAMAIIMRASAKDRLQDISVENHKKVFPYIKHIIEWLRTTDFYTAPASTKYHDACYAGLLTHTLMAYNQLVSLRSVAKFKQVVDDQWWSAVFVILVHDWCKIGRYESYWKNVKDERTGEWTQVSAYRYNENPIGRLGHGTQSLIMAMQLCNNNLTALSFEEMAAIRWHMDNWDVTKFEAEDLYSCDSNIPMVRMVQFADQLATTTY